MSKHEEMVAAIGDVLELFGTAEYLAESFCEMDAREQVELFALIASISGRWEAGAIGQWHAIGREARIMAAADARICAGIDVLREIVAAFGEGGNS